MIAGIDEAGKGPVLGPMVVTCLVFDENRIKELEAIGVKDSKMLSKKTREELFELILKLSKEVIFKIIQPYEIDLAVKGLTYKNLNYLEASIIAEMIDQLKSPIKAVYIDSPHPIANKFAFMIKQKLKRKDIHIIAENNADKKYLVVAAASIIAKVERDRRIKELSEKYGNIGSGYPSDWRTIRFIENWFKEKGELPPFVRKSWKTARKIVEKYNFRQLL